MASPFRLSHALPEAVDLPTDAGCLPPVSSGDVTSPHCDSPSRSMVTLSRDLGTSTECRGLSRASQNRLTDCPRRVRVAYLAAPDAFLSRGNTLLPAVRDKPLVRRTEGRTLTRI